MTGLICEEECQLQVSDLFDFMALRSMGATCAIPDVSADA